MTSLLSGATDLDPSAASVTDPSQLTKLLRGELGSYMDYHLGLDKLKALCPPDFDVLAFSGPWLEFTKVPQPSRSVADFVAYLANKGFAIDSALAQALEKRIKGGNLFVHQENAIEAILSGKSVILPHPTGTGKTECFVVPILNFLLEQIRQKDQKTFGLGAIMIFPTKALENDQRDRLKEFLYQLEQTHKSRIPRIGVYDGDTPHRAQFERFERSNKREKLRAYTELCPKCGKDTLRYNIGHKDHLLWCDDSRKSPEGEPLGCGYPRPTYEDGIPWIRTTREDMCESEHFPNLLITNPEALDYQLLQRQELGLFRTKMSRVIVVIDEAHAYDAEACLSFRILLSRLEQKINDVNGRNVSIQYVISSATLDKPTEFASRLIPWVSAEIIEFVQKPDPFPDVHSIERTLSGPIIAFNPSEPDWVFDSFGKPAGNSPMIGTLLHLQAATVSNGLLQPCSPEMRQAWTHWNLDRASSEAKNLFRAQIKRELLAVRQARELYSKVQADPATLEALAKWWTSQWPNFNENQAIETITALVYIGRKLQLWNERWHLFVRTPTGFAGCTGTDFHPYRVSSEEPLLTSCSRCAPPTPVLEVMTCQQCGEIYYIVYECSGCDPVTLWPSADTTCSHGPALQAAIIERDLCVGVTDLSSLRDQAHLINRHSSKTIHCGKCDEPLVEVKRRSDQVIEMSVSLIGWHADERRRKFLLFSDGRASSERIAREFNNQEKLLWAERLVMNCLMRDPSHGPHDVRTLSDVRTTINRELRDPYTRALRPVLSKYEWESLDQSLWLCVLRAVGKSSLGASRLFEQGLLAYAFPDEVSQRAALLGVDDVLPRVADLIRLHETYEKGLSRSALLEWFTGTDTGPRKLHPAARAHLEALAGPGHQNVLNAISVMENAGWVAEETDSSKPTPEAYYWFREGEASDEDPFEVPHDPRLIRVPEEVSRCPACGLIRWYHLAICENCGTAMAVVSHKQLLELDYFAGILTRSPVPIVSAVHRAGLDSFERRALEERFQAEVNSVHLLCATPTLELGIDVGFLNFVILAKVPATRSSYIQRVGRAGRRRDEGAMCITFAYPTPVDSHFFHHPQGLVSMRSSRVPVQRLSPGHLQSFVWAAVFDCFAKRRSLNAGATFDGTVTTRFFLEDRAPLKRADLAAVLHDQWDQSYGPYARDVLSRCIVAGIDRVDAGTLDAAVTAAKAITSSLATFGIEILCEPSFVAQRDAIEKLHTSVSKSIAALRQKKNKTNEELEQLDRLDTQNENILEYKRTHMMSSPILNYLHDAGTLPTPRGIGASVLTYDLESMDRALDDRETGLSITERFPGALISRQGAIYQVKRLVHDPLKTPEVILCSVCRAWLDDTVKMCPEHPATPVEKLTLRQPVVGFAELTRFRNRETRGTFESALRFKGDVLSYDGFHVGSLPLDISPVVDLEVAVICREYSVLDGGREVDRHVPLMACANCGNFTDDETKCCENQHPEPIVQGQTYTTRAMNIRVDPSTLANRITSAVGAGIQVSEEGPAQSTQSLSFALLNALAIALDVEPSVLDAWRAPDNSVWIYEPTPGGLGILDDLRLDATLLQQTLDTSIDLVKTRPGDHECKSFCEQCLLVPRRVFDVAHLLNRPLLEAIES